MDIQHDIRQKKFYTTKNEREFSLEYNEVEDNLWEFHCAYNSGLSAKDKEVIIQNNLIEYALRYMERNKIQILENGSCYSVKDYIESQKDLKNLVKNENV